MSAWLLAIIAAQSLDIASTCMVLNRGGRELNPMIPSSCAGSAAVKGSLTAGSLITLGTGKFQQRHPRLFKIYASAVIVSGAVGVVHNIREIRK